MSTEKDSNKENANDSSGGFGLGRALLILLFLFIVAGVMFYVTQYQDVALKPSKETTEVTEPLDSAGNVDFFSAFEKINYTADIATGDNGFRLIVENIDIFHEVPGPHFGIVCKKLGLDPATTKPKLSYADPYEFALEYYRSPDYDESKILPIEKRLADSIQFREEGAKLLEWDVCEILVVPTVRPWTQKDVPMMAAWVNDNSPALDLYAKAVRCKVFEIPFSREDDTKSMYEELGYHMQELRAVARGYLSRANYYLGRGELRKAMDDVISCKRLGRHIVNRNTLIDRLLGIAIEGISDAIGVIDVRKDSSTKEDLEYFRDELKKIPKRNSLDLAFGYDKWAQLDWLQRGASSDNTKWLDNDAGHARQFRQLGLDWNIVLSDFILAYDHIVKTNESMGIAELKPSLIDYLSREARSRKFAKWYARNGSGIAVREAAHRSICADQLREITLAMLLYEKENGTLPPAFTTDKSGNPLHSWRVLLLPYLGEKDLYDKIKLDEPWNSPHNSKFELECPDVFACPSNSQRKDGQTTYTVVLGTDLPFESNKGKKLSAFGKDCDDMILVAERTVPVSWMDPKNELTKSEAAKGINFDDSGKRIPLPMGSEHPGGAQFGFRNGSANFLSETIEAKVLLDLLRGMNRKFNP